MIDRRPGFIVRCTDVADIITALRFAREHELLLAGLVIDLSMMKGVRVDPVKRTARVSGGCTWGDVDHATHAFGLATPSGIIADKIRH
ncbi:MAG: FAD-binding protein [Chthoniobacterales bacterium]